jgi:hypothetical protein
MSLLRGSPCSLTIELNLTRHFSYSSGSLSSNVLTNIASGLTPKVGRKMTDGIISYSLDVTRRQLTDRMRLQKR